MMPRRRIRILALAAFIPLAGTILGVAVRRVTGNFGTVVRGKVYRSGQMRAGQLGHALETYAVRTVLNLRGPNPESAWYRAETEATLHAAATQVDVAMASDQWLSQDQARAIVQILERCEKPVLIHCEWGAERTGLISAFARLLEPGSTLDAARAEFSARYLFLPIRDGLMMRGHLDRYAAWLSAQNLTHSPQAFRTWVRAGYQPGSPCREQWPYDPYPLATITRPGTRSLAVLWSRAGDRRPPRR